MHALKTALALCGFTILSSACSSGLEENAKPLALSARVDAAFAMYDTDSDGAITAKELFKIENHEGSTVIRTEAEAQSVLADFDPDGNGTLDMLEFSALLDSGILVGVNSK